MFRITITILLFVLITTCPVFAQWSQDPADAIQLPGIYNVILVSDSLGGVFILGSANFRQYCYYLDANGYPRWDEWVYTAPLADFSMPTGYSICPEIGYFIILGNSEWYTDEGDTSWDLRAQKIDSNGEFAWPDSGVSVSNMRVRLEDHAYYEVIGMESDGDGGVIITWVIKYKNEQGRLFRQPFRAQRISPEGELLWGEEGVEIVSEDSLASFGRIVPDGEGGVIILYYLGGLRAQRISQNGDKLWGETGVRYMVNSPRFAIPDGSGGVIITVGRGGRGQVRVLRISADGQLAWGDDEGLLVGDAYRAHESYIVQASDSVFFINWTGDTDEQPNPLVQAVDLSGELIWDWPGVEISSADSIQYNMRGVASFNSTIYAWHDNRDINGIAASVYAQRIDTNGNRLWGEDDVLLLNRSGVGVSNVVSDANGGAIFFLGRSYLQYINRDGELGIPLTIRSVDQPLLEGILTYTIFPNPANSMTTLNFTTPVDRNVVLKFYDLHGRFLFDTLINPDAMVHPLDVSKLPSGSYMLQLSGATGSSRMLNIIK